MKHRAPPYTLPAEHLPTAHLNVTSQRQPYPDGALFDDTVRRVNRRLFFGLNIFRRENRREKNFFPEIFRLSQIVLQKIFSQKFPPARRTKSTQPASPANPVTARPLHRLRRHVTQRQTAIPEKAGRQRMWPTKKFFPRKFSLLENRPLSYVA